MFRSKFRPRHTKQEQKVWNDNMNYVIVIVAGGVELFLGEQKYEIVTEADAMSEQTPVLDLSLRGGQPHCRRGLGAVKQLRPTRQVLQK